MPRYVNVLLINNNILVKFLSVLTFVIVNKTLNIICIVCIDDAVVYVHNSGISIRARRVFLLVFHIPYTTAVITGSILLTHLRKW